LARASVITSQVITAPVSVQDVFITYNDRKLGDFCYGLTAHSTFRFPGMVALTSGRLRYSLTRAVTLRFAIPTIGPGIKLGCPFSPTKVAGFKIANKWLLAASSEDAVVESALSFFA